MASSELFNIYVEKLTNHIAELTKANLLQSAQLSFLEQSNSILNKKVEELEKELANEDTDLNKPVAKSKKSDSEF